MIELNSLDDFTFLAESSDLECKLAGGKNGRGELPRDFWETYSAMANTDGGVVLLGVKQKGMHFELAGIEDTEGVIKILFDTANNPGKTNVNLLNNNDVLARCIAGHNFIQIKVRRAARQERPVYLNGNPLKHTFVRRHEGDQRLSEEAVKRMLAEQTEDARDSRILRGFGLEDLCGESVKTYRQIFANRDPGHPWNELEARPFLKNIGAWKTNRETGESGLTAAGLLMFGYHSNIQENFPYYMLDYQERPEAKTEKRWIDRLTLDGSWSGNLYDFYRKVYPKLTEGVKVPFEISDGQRVDETPIHTAIREALCNVLVHADYSDRASVLVVKRPDLFGFRNPGMMRIPVEFALQGGHPDCRNRLLHQMFRYVGIGDQAGSGIPKIVSSWNQCHWRLPELVDTREPFDQTIMRMRMIDLFPQDLVDDLRSRFGSAFDALSNDERAALAIAAVENTVTHQRLLTLQNLHPADVSRCLHGLVAQGLLEQTGSNRGAVYHLTGIEIPGPEDVFDSQNLEESSLNLSESSPNLEQSSLNSQRDKMGRLISENHDLMFVDDLEKLGEAYLQELEKMAEEPRSKKKLPRATMKSLLLELLDGQYVTISCLAELLQRDQETLRGQYLSQMVKDGELEYAFPRTPNDPRQAYTKSK